MFSKAIMVEMYWDWSSLTFRYILLALLILAAVAHEKKADMFFRSVRAMLPAYSAREKFVALSWPRCTCVCDISPNPVISLTLLSLRLQQRTAAFPLRSPASRSALSYGFLSGTITRPDLESMRANGSPRTLQAPLHLTFYISEN